MFILKLWSNVNFYKGDDLFLFWTVVKYNRMFSLDKLKLASNQPILPSFTSHTQNHDGSSQDNFQVLSVQSKCFNPKMIPSGAQRGTGVTP